MALGSRLLAHAQDSRPPASRLVPGQLHWNSYTLEPPLASAKRDVTAISAEHGKSSRSCTLRHLAIGVAMLACLACGPAAGGALSATPSVAGHAAPTRTGPSAVLQSEEITYGNDGYRAQRCSGLTADLHYVVFYPADPGPHPVVFGMEGTGFGGSADCPHGAKRELYRGLDGIMHRWAAAGYVAVNIEYHGARDGLFGDLTYPRSSSWAGLADGTVELDIKPAMEHFLAHDASQFHADERLGLVVFGSSSGAHNAYMVGATGLPGHHISAVVGWSGLPDAERAGSYAEHIFDSYMRTTPGSDVENFGDPAHRLQARAPSQYIANGLAEFIAPETARAYYDRCQSLGIVACWLRIPNTQQHADGYAGYVFTGQSPESTIPATQPGQTVQQDTIFFAERYASSAA